MSSQSTLFRILPVVLCTACLTPLSAQPPGPGGLPGGPDPADPSPPRPLAPLSAELKSVLDDAVALNPEQTVWLTKQRDKVLLRTQVACNDCLLEMLCYNERAEKAHESLLWIRAAPKAIHMALLATGAKAGSPVSFTPEFVPPKGPRIDIYLHWVDADGQQRREKAQTWMRKNVSRYYSVPLAEPPAGIEFPFLELRYDPYNKEILWYGQMTDDQKKTLLAKCDDKMYQAAIEQFHKESQPTPMNAEFVFTGSYTYTIEETGEKIYAADSGYVLCVANFTGALVDIREPSSAADGGQAWEAWTERMPPRGTPVIIELVPDTTPPADPPAKEKTPAAAAASEQTPANKANVPGKKRVP
ncbi:MAG: YdjY domain-containing protein [Planctomycetaceae bacterium]|nr:YdjY domain-containing protein [Planctomycetaceae bacterium]